MKVQLQFKQTKNEKFWYYETQLMRIKELDQEWNYVKFAKQSPELIEKLQNVTIELPDTLI